MPAPAPTELLAEDIRDLRESNQRIAARMDGIESAIRELGRDLGHFRTDVAEKLGTLNGDLGHFRADVAEKLGAVNGDLSRFRTDVAEKLGAVNGDLSRFRADVAEKLGVINSQLESLRVRLDDSVSVAKWTIGILAPVVIGLVSAGFWLTWQAAKLDSRVERVEIRLGKEQLVPAPIPKRP